MRGVWRCIAVFEVIKVLSIVDLSTEETERVFYREKELVIMAGFR